MRGIAAFLGAFAIVNVIGGLFVHGFGANVWWIRTAALPERARDILIGCAGAVLLAHAFGRCGGERLRQAGSAVLGIVAGFALANSAEFFALTVKGRIHAWVPVPLSGIVSVVVIWIALNLWRRQSGRLRRHEGYALFAVAGASAVAFPLAQMLFFGTTDYRQRADAAVVLGARTYADGSASQALSDRVSTAVELYRQGLVGLLIFSGGPGDGGTSEPQAMRRIAIASGVPEDSIRLDEAGVNTDATVKNTALAFSELKIRRVLVVSHAYHLPRIKLAYQRAGREVRTVPARQTQRLRNEPLFVAREVVAIWAYYLRPIVS
jgi:vancomycin permeability regulator SanA